MNKKKRLTPEELEELLNEDEDVFTLDHYDEDPYEFPYESAMEP
jgi:hypothetical protein